MARFNHWQYQYLKGCSARGKAGIDRWNKWRLKHPDRDILLEGADLSRSHLDAAYLNHKTFRDGSGIKHHFDGEVRLESANLEWACLREANLHHATLTGANLWGADLRDADLRRTDLERATLRGANLEGAVLRQTKLQGAGCRMAIVDRHTVIRRCEVDKDTDFHAVNLATARIESGTRQLLEYNVRRMHWRTWYTWRDWWWDEPKQKRGAVSMAAHWMVHGFWWVSDYGRSTGRIVMIFFACALGFATIYYVAAISHPPGFVNSLLEGDEGTVPGWLVPFRAIYFSVVTMTTLGFGDMYANSQSVFGHVLLTFQVLLGYVLLAALVTRFAVLFTAGGPAGRFAERK